MQYIGKSKEGRKFKAFDSISDIKESDFANHDIFQTMPINKQQYGELLKQKQIEDLKNQLTALGVDLNTLVRPAPQETVENQNTTIAMDAEVIKSQEKQGELDELGIKKLSEEDIARKPSKIIKNHQTKEAFTMGELQANFVQFKEHIEKEIPEIMFSSCNETGITLTMIQGRNDIPKQLPNGIPVRQILG